MKLQEKLKLYQETLKKDEPANVFNPRAFVFNSFYYFYHDVSFGKFLAYFLATPLLFALFVLLKATPVAAFFTAVLAVRTVAGFRANIDLKKHMKEFVDEYKDVDFNPQPVVYFSVPLTRLFFASLISFGLYEVYWAYKNWQAVRRCDREYNIIPFCRSWLFGIFFIFPLFLRMKKSFEQTVPVGKGFVFCATAYFLLYITGAVAGQISNNSDTVTVAMVISDFTLALLSALCLLPIQKAVNRHNQKLSPGNKPLSKFLFGEKITISVSLLLTVLSFVIGYKKESGESFFNQTENMFLTTMYVHEQVYPEICKKHGYEMRRYPEIFRRIFSAERSRIEQTLKSRDISPTEFWNQIPEKYRTKIFARLEQTMLEISRETKAQYPQNLLATVTGLCTYMDENAEQVIRKQISTN